MKLTWVPSGTWSQKGEMDAWILPTLDTEACTRCGACVTQCPEHVVALRAGELIFVNPGACTYCGLCESICPTSAIALTYAIVWDGSDLPGKGSTDCGTTATGGAIRIAKP